MKALRRAAGWAAACLFLLPACAPLAPYNQGRVDLVPYPSHPGSSAGPSTREIRVLLAQDQKALRLSAPGGLSLADSASHAEVARLQADGKTLLTSSEGHFTLGGQALGTASLDLSSLDPNETVYVAGRPYHGRLSVVAGGHGKVYLVNRVDLEDYLAGVLSSEVPASWPAETLKAQAVASRTYAIFRAEQGEHPEFDLDDSTRSQVYRGRLHEEERARAAVAATQGQILTWQGKPAQCFFFSNCGGHTADAAKVWGGGAPYLRGVACHFCANEKHARWQGQMSLSTIEARLAKAGLLEGSLSGIEPLDRDESGRWTKVRLDATLGSKVVKSSAFRAALGADLLRSANFEVRREGDNFNFDGRGWGHGIGLCQEGAKGMGQEGYGYRNILEFYYPGTVLKKLW